MCPYTFVVGEKTVDQRHLDNPYLKRFINPKCHKYWELMFQGGLGDLIEVFNGLTMKLNSPNLSVLDKGLMTEAVAVIKTGLNKFAVGWDS